MVYRRIEMRPIGPIVWITDTNLLARVTPAAFMPLATVTRSYLDLAPGMAPRREPPPADCAWRMLDGSAWRETRQLYIDVGSRWAWRDRLVWSDGQWAALIAAPSTRVYVLEVGGVPGGYVELSRVGAAIELAYFGLMAFAQGRGLGRWMLERAIAEAQDWGAARIWLHTCTLDSPAALPNYLARGFRVVRTETYAAELPGA
jgi:GNAT superfamily N-acetyltransferase